MQALEGVVLYKIDGAAEKELKESYGVKGFPVFILSNAAGTKTEKWASYPSKETFIETLEQKLNAITAD